MVWSARDDKPVRKTFGSVRAARAWRARARVELSSGRLDAPSKVTLGEAAERWLSDAEAGVVRTRSGDRYKPSALRSYEQALRARILPRFGSKRLSALSRPMLQALVDELVGEGCAPSTVRNAVLPVRAIYRRALQRDELAGNPTLKLALPAVRERRERVARPAEAEALLAALPAVGARPLWATALYTGLRRGELQALQWQNVELDRGLVRVEHSWDRCAGLIEPKSRAGRRRVPIPARCADNCSPTTCPRAGPTPAGIAALSRDGVHRRVRLSGCSNRGALSPLVGELATRRFRQARARAGGGATAPQTRKSGGRVLPRMRPARDRRLCHRRRRCPAGRLRGH